MFRPADWLRRLGYLLHRRRHDRLLMEEMAAHREMLAVPARFGNARRLREAAHDAWGWRWFDDLGRDARLACAFLLRSPGFAATAVGSLALGFVLMATTAVVVNAYLVRPLPYGGAPERLYHVMYAPPGPWEPGGLATMDWNAVRDVIEWPITAAGDTYYLVDGGYAQTARGLRVNQGFVHGLGVRAVEGRTLGDDDWHADSDAVAMIGYGLWRVRYDGDPSIVGRVIRLEAESAPGVGDTVRVVGVLAPDFYFGRDSSAVVDILRPLASPGRTYLARLRPGIPTDVAERRLTEAARAVATDLPGDWTGVHLESARERYVGEMRPILFGAAGLAVLVLSLVSANVTILTLLRGIRREREMAVRLALGSGRWRLVRMLLMEATAIAVAAVVAGLALATLALRSLAPVIQARLGRPAPGGLDSLTLDLDVVAAIAAAGLLVAVALAVLPALFLRDQSVGRALRQERGATTDSTRSRRVRSVLLTIQVAGTVVLLVIGGLLVQSTQRMIRTDLGFPVEGLYRSRITLRNADYADASFSRFYRQFDQAGSQRIGTSLVFSTWPPYADLPVVQVETPQTVGAGVAAGSLRIGGGYFATLDVRLVEGRDLTDADESEGAAVAVVSETLARALRPSGTVLGQQVRPVEVTAGGSTPGPWLTVVGVVADVRQHYFDPTVADLYRPLPLERDRFGSFYVRSALGPADLWPLLRETAAAIDPNAIVTEPRPVAAENQALEGARFLSTAITGVAVAAVLLAALGIYAVTAFSVQQQSRETALRIALGATPNRIRRQFLRRVGVTLGVGTVLGLGVAGVVSQVVSGGLYGIPPLHLPTIVVAVGFMVGVGLVATWPPVQRATRQSPAAVLKDV